MSCVPCEGAVSQEDLDRWTDSITNVLHSREGRKRFQEFLSSRGLEESEATMEFWERCERLITVHHRHGGGHHKSSQVAHLRFLKDARDLVTYAEDKVNLDLAQMRCLYEAVETGREEVIRPVLIEAVKTAEELMEDDYQLFRKYLLRQHGVPVH